MGANGATRALCNARSGIRVESAIRDIALGITDNNVGAIARAAGVTIARESTDANRMLVRS